MDVHGADVIEREGSSSESSQATAILPFSVANKLPSIVPIACLKTLQHTSWPVGKEKAANTHTQQRINQSISSRTHNICFVRPTHSLNSTHSILPPNDFIRLDFLLPFTFFPISLASFPSSFRLLSKMAQYVPWYRKRSPPIFCGICIPVYIGVWPARKFVVIIGFLLFLIGVLLLLGLMLTCIAVECSYVFVHLFPIPFITIHRIRWEFHH